MKVYLLYCGLNTSSLQLLAVCTTYDKAVELADLHSQEGEKPFDEYTRDELMNESATFGRDENYKICETETDELEG